MCDNVESFIAEKYDFNYFFRTMCPVGKVSCQSLADAQ
jgi:hypothetical protein